MGAGGSGEGEGLRGWGVGKWTFGGVGFGVAEGG